MQDAGQIYSDNNLQQRQQYGRTVRCNYRSNQTENTNRSNSHDHADDFVGNLSQTIDGVFQSVSFFTDNSNTGTNEERENDDLQHVGFNHSFQRVSRENVNDNLGNRRCSFSSNFSSISSHMQANTRLHNGTDCQTDNDSKSSGYQIVRYSFNTDTAYLFDITQAGNTDYQTGEYQRYDNHFDHVHENCSQRTNPGLGEAGTFSTQLQACNNTKRKAD